MRYLVAIALASAVLLLAACGSNRVRPAPAPGAAGGSGAVDNIHLPQSERYRLQHDRGPGSPPVDINQLPEPVPRVEPRSRYGNKSPYTVRGRTYHVLPTAKGYDERGLASWYGKKFDGYLTSSMERYDMYRFSAASKVLPLPSFARVTNLANGKSVIVRVNDRGPFVAGRIIDLSYAAAVRIGIWPKGTGMVEVQAIDPAAGGELPAAPVVTPADATYPVWLQAGSFGQRDNAERLAQQLRRAGLPVQVRRVTVGGRRLSRVRLGPLVDAASVRQAGKVLRRMGLNAVPVAVN